MSINVLGVNFRHDPGFVIDRHRGCGDRLFLCVLSEAHIWLEGVEVRAPVPSCILYPAGSYEKYTGSAPGLLHHFLHFTGSGVDACLGDTDLPPQKIIPLSDTLFIETALRKIQMEAFHKRERWCEIAFCHFQAMIHEIVRMHREQVLAKSTPQRFEQMEKLRRVRADMHTSPEQEWTVSRLAQKAHLSVSRFAHLYRECFGISPIEDVIQARLLRACELLRSTGMTNAAISESSGFVSPEHFARLFRRHFGVTPRVYALNNHGWAAK